MRPVYVRYGHISRVSRRRLGIHPIHRLGNPLGEEGLDAFDGAVEDGAEFGGFAAVEVLEDVVDGVEAGRGAADADAQAGELVGSELIDDVANAPLAAGASLVAQA